MSAGDVGRFVARALSSIALDVSPSLSPDSGCLDPAPPALVLVVAAERLGELWPESEGGRLAVAHALLVAADRILEHPAERVPSKRWPRLGAIPHRPPKEVSGCDTRTLEALAVRWAARLHFVKERLPL